MLRLPPFEYHEPQSIEAALALKQEAGEHGMYVAGGTDLYPNMKRRHQEPTVVISLSRIADLRQTSKGSNGGLTVGSGLTLTEVANHEVSNTHPAVAHAARLVSTPLLRNTGTLGGNLCLDTRCNYYNQSYEWRKAIDFCMKKDGAICWVAPSSPRCWAVQSSDVAPVMVALDAEYVLASPAGERVVPAGRFYHDDGIDYLTKQRDEILTAVRLPAPNGWDATYWKLRRRGSFDFPVLGVAIRLDWLDGTVERATIVLGAVSSHVQRVEDAEAAIIGTSLDDSAIDAAATAAFKPSKPMDNTDFGLAWRKEMTRVYVRGALRELRDRQPAGR
jgi:4-hydroxybenzoyl-CoA reductase subunit beta